MCHEHPKTSHTKYENVTETGIKLCIGIKTITPASTVTIRTNYQSQKCQQNALNRMAFRQRLPFFTAVVSFAT